MQHPTLGESFIIEFARGNPDYPILGVLHDPLAAGYRAPVAAHAHPNTSKYPLHTFTGTQLTNTDRGVIWIYRRLPEPEADGQDLDNGLNLVLPYKESIVALGSAIGNASTEVRPGDYNERTAIKKTYSDPSVILDAFHEAYPSHVNLGNELPDVLEDILVDWDEDSAIGESSDGGSGLSTGDANISLSLSLSASGSGQGSASLIPSITPVIRSYFARRVPSVQHVIFLPLPITEAQIRTKLSAILTPVTVLAWPQFRPQSHIFTLKGGLTNVSCSAKAQCHASISYVRVDETVGSATSNTESEGEGYDVSINRSVQKVIIPPTIHGSISFTSGEHTKTKTTTATAEAVVAGGTNFPGASSNITKEVTVNGSITPTSISATSPTTIPSSGLYLYKVDVSMYRHGYAMIVAEVIDFSNL